MTGSYPRNKGLLQFHRSTRYLRCLRSHKISPEGETDGRVQDTYNGWDWIGHSLYLCTRYTAYICSLYCIFNNGKDLQLKKSMCERDGGVTKHYLGANLQPVGRSGEGGRDQYRFQLLVNIYRDRQLCTYI